MQCLEVSGAVRLIYGSLGVKRLICVAIPHQKMVKRTRLSVRLIRTLPYFYVESVEHNLSEDADGS